MRKSIQAFVFALAAALSVALPSSALGHDHQRRGLAVGGECSECDFSNKNLAGAAFINADFSDSTFAQSEISNSSFMECRFSDTDFSETVMSHAVLQQLILKSFNDMLLPDNISKGLRPPFSCYYFVCHNK